MVAYCAACADRSLRGEGPPFPILPALWHACDFDLVECADSQCFLCGQVVRERVREIFLPTTGETLVRLDP